MSSERNTSLLKTAADLTDIVIEKLDDMGKIDSYDDIREAPFSEGDKAAVHAPAEEADEALFGIRREEL